MTDPEQREQRNQNDVQTRPPPGRGPLRSFGWVKPSAASSRGGAVTATKLGHPMRLACTSDALSASVDP
jgi:hypothetical protein